MAISQFSAKTQYFSYEGMLFEDYIILDIPAMAEGEKLISVEIKQSGQIDDVLKFPILISGITRYYLNLPLPQTPDTAQTLNWSDIWNAMDYGVKLYMAQRFGASASDCGSFLRSVSNLNAIVIYYKNGNATGGATFEMYTYTGGDYVYLPVEIDYPLTLTCNFDTAGGGDAPPSQAVLGQKSLVVTRPPDPLKEGETFGGWALSAEGQAIAFPYTYTTEESSGDIDFTLYALWGSVSHDATYYLDGGTNNALNPLSYDKDTAFNFYDPYKAGHTFLGWYDSAEGGNRKYGIVKNSGEGLTFYARWSKKPVAKGGHVY